MIKAGFGRRFALPQNSSDRTRRVFRGPILAEIVALVVMALGLAVGAAPANASDGTFSRMWGWGVDDGTAAFQICTGGCQAGSPGSGDGQFDSPAGVATDAAGDVYVVDYINHRIQKFDSDGTFITKWGTNGSGDGQFDFPLGVATDAAGDVYVADTSNNRIQKFDSDGTFITKWGTFGSGDGRFHLPYGVATDAAGDVYVADNQNRRIQKFDSDGTFITKWGSTGSGDGQFESPAYVATDAAGDVYVTDYSNDRIQKFDSDGTFITKWGSTGSGDGQLDTPLGVATDAAGDVYVADRGNQRIQKFDSDGTFITKWGSIGSFNSPQGVATDAAGDVYVAEDNRHRIQKFGTANQAPTADAGADYEVGSGAISFLDGSGSSDPDDDPLDYSWTQTSGPSVTVNGADTALASFVAPPGPATLEFELEVCDGEPLCDTDTVAVAVNAPPNQPPTADAGPDQTVDSNANVDLDGSASSDPDPSDTLDYAWTQTGEQNVELSGADTATPSFTAPTGPASLEFELEVCDGEPLCDTDTVVITVEASPPTAVDDQATVDEDSGATPIDVLGNDLDFGGPSLEITSVTQPANGTVVVAPDDLSLSYEPDPDYCNEPGPEPTDDFSYTLNGGSEASVAVTVTCVDDVPDAPTITGTAPASPANDNTPEAQGTLGAGNPTQVRIYASADCTGPVAATGTAAEFLAGGITVTVADNTTTPLSAIAVGGSDSACSNTVSYIEDSAAPNTLIDSGPIGPTNNPSPSFAFHSPEPGASFECRLDASTGGTWAPCDSPKDYTGLAQGPHRFEVRAIDAAANTDPTPARRTFNVDTTPPNTLIDSGPIGPTNNPSPSFAFHSRQPNVTFECRLDPSAGGTWAPCSSPKDYTNLPQGPHRFEVRAIDAAGNADPSPAVHTFNVDTTPPNTLIDSGPIGPTNNPSPSFAFHSPQPNVTFECRLDPSTGGTWAPCSSPKDYTNLPQGPHTFEVRAIDAAGNADPSPAVRTFNVVP